MVLPRYARLNVHDVTLLDILLLSSKSEENQLYSEVSKVLGLQIQSFMHTRIMQIDPFGV
jgi:hypothetical protein